MSTLALRLEKDLDGGTSVALGQVFDRRGELVAAPRIPVGFQAQHLELELPEGSYLVRALLPSGEYVNQHVELLPGVRKPVDIPAHGSEHEWLSWHHFSNGAGARDAVVPKRRSAFMMARRHDESPILESLRLVSPAMHDIVMEDLTGVGQTTVTLRGMVVQAWVYGYGPHVLVRLTARVDGGSAQFQPVRALVKCAGEPESIVCLPMPWPGQQHASSRDEEACAVEILLQSRDDRQAGVPGPVVSVLVKDAVYGPLLAYLSSGDLASALELVRVERSRPFVPPRQQPYAFASIEYVLLEGEGLANQLRGTATDRHYRLEATKALRDECSWMPDGAVLHGSHLLRSGDVESARREFETAIDRGVPVFTAGLRLLLEGLRRVEALDDLKKIGPYAASADPQQPFTTLNSAALEAGGVDVTSLRAREIAAMALA